MNYLLDTHALLWWLSDSPELLSDAREIIASPDNLIFVSAASAWEISIKKSLGKLSAPDDLSSAIEFSGFEPLAITIEHAQMVGSLPFHHTDPFDRMIVAQAVSEALIIVSRDKKMRLYEVPIVGA